MDEHITWCFVAVPEGVDVVPVKTFVDKNAPPPRAVTTSRKMLVVIGEDGIRHEIPMADWTEVSWVCRHCGMQHDFRDRYCTNCGASL